MPLAPPPVVDARPLFRPVSAALVTELRTLPPSDWTRRTTAGEWLVRDIAAHLTDGALRRLSFHRDRHSPPPPPHPIEGERDFVRFINTLNAEWVSAARRFSPAVLVDMLALASEALADWFEQLPLDAPALFPVSWAGEVQSEGWFDIGREFTELWHHQQQIRLAVGAPSLADTRYLRAVLDIAVRGLPHAFRHVAADRGHAIVVDVEGPAGGQWTLLEDGGRWTLWAGAAPPETPQTRVRLTDEAAWRLWFNGLPPAEAASQVHVQGDQALAAPFLQARSVIV